MLSREILSKIRQIEIRTKRTVDTSLGGEYHSVFKGHGDEFSEVREYQIGDEICRIDWNVSARMGRTFVKKFVEERELTVMLLVDASASQNFGSQSQTKREIASELAAVLAFSAIKNNDRIGLVIFTDQIEKYVPPKKGRQHVLRLIREILCFTPVSKGTNLSRALEYLYRMQKRHTIAFIISDFISPDFTKSLKVANQKHDVIAIKISDPREQNLPNIGLIELENAETKETLLIDTSSAKARQLFELGAVHQAASVAKALKQVDCIEISADKSYLEPIVNFFRQRERRYR